MLYPPIGELMENFNSRYELVIVTAKRARQLVDRATVLTDKVSSNPVTTAVNEIYEGKISKQEEVNEQ
jgi:DNA-directed RNA polymerase subunit omega